MDPSSKTPNRHYTYEELLDLQSRLMLVAGQAEKGKENVDRFISVSQKCKCEDTCVMVVM